MRNLFRRGYAIITLGMLVGLPPHVAYGGVIWAPATCPSHTVCDRALGIALSPPAGWVRLRPPRVPPHEIDLARPAHGPNVDLRLVIRSLGTTAGRNDRRAAWVAAGRLRRSYRAPGATRTPVRYAGAPGILLRGMPPTPRPAVDIVLAHAGALYLIILPGTGPAPDQRAALASLHMISRVGPFPPVNPTAPLGLTATRTIPPTLRVTPSPVPLGRALTVMLAGVRPRATIVFQVAPLASTGFGGGLMGRYRAGPAGTIRFTYPPFRTRGELGRWRITASRRGARLTSTVIRVVGSSPTHG